MNMNSISFNSDGPIMSGTWINPSNGDTFVVKDSFFQDNQYMVQTTDGRILDYNFIQHYVKTDDVTQNNIKQSSFQSNKTALESAKQLSDLPNEVKSILDQPANYNVDQNDDFNDYILDEDRDLINNPIKQSSVKLTSKPITQTTSNNVEYPIISKVLEGTPLPSFKISCSWDNCPVEKIEALMKLLNVEESNILDWYVSNIDIEKLKMQIIDEYKDNISKYIKKHSSTPIIEEPPIKKIKRVKKSVN